MPLFFEIRRYFRVQRALPRRLYALLQASLLFHVDISSSPAYRLMIFPSADIDDDYFRHATIFSSPLSRRRRCRFFAAPIDCVFSGLPRAIATLLPFLSLIISLRCRLSAALRRTYLPITLSTLMPC